MMFRCLMWLMLCGPIMALTACNNDIFIEDFTPTEMAFSLPGSGGSHTISLASSEGVVMTVVMSAGDYAFETVDASGNHSRNNWLEGDGRMHITHPRIDMEVTRKGKSVDIVLNHFYSKEGESVEFYFASEYKSHSDVLTIKPYNPFKLMSFDYNSGSTAVLDGMGTSITLFQGSVANHGDSEMKFPFVLDRNGIPVTYKFFSESAYDMPFSMIEGSIVPVPGSTRPDQWQWGLLGDEAAISDFGIVTLNHFPKMPEIGPIPGNTSTRIELMAETEAMRFAANAAVLNEHTGVTYNFIVWLLMDFPFKYKLIRNDTAL